jgi:hypothetical protein
VTAIKAPMSTAVVPTLSRRDWSLATRWWKPETGIGRACNGCGGRLCNEAPMGKWPGRVVCLLGCARTVAWISATGWE